MSNERIRELSKQAGQGDMFSVPPKFIDLFAKLIVAECVGVAEQEDTDVMMKEGYPCSQTAKKIRDHFGMK